MYAGIAGTQHDRASKKPLPAIKADFDHLAAFLHRDNGGDAFVDEVDPLNRLVWLEEPFIQPQLNSPETRLKQRIIAA